jgi:hypothetical protein
MLAVQTLGVTPQVTGPIGPSAPCPTPLAIANVKASPSASLADSVIALGVSSLVLTLCASATGVALGGTTVIASVSMSVLAPPAPVWPRSSLATVSVSGPVYAASP